MGVHFSPVPQRDGKNSKSTIIPASTSPFLIQVNEIRLNGYIENKVNKSMWVKFGDPAVAPLLTAARPFTEVAANGKIDIPEDFTGPIGLIWSSGFTNNANAIAILTEILP